MTLVTITLFLLSITVLCYIAGTIWLSQYAARLGAGPRIMTLLLPPYAFYFAFYKLDQDTKHKPVFLWSFGVVATIILTLLFAEPLGYFIKTGDTTKLDPDAPGAVIKKPSETPAPAAAPAAPTTPAAPADGAAPAAPVDGAAPAAPVDGAAPAAPAAPVDGAAPAAPAAPTDAAPAAPAAPAAAPADAAAAPK